MEATPIRPQISNSNTAGQRPATTVLRSSGGRIGEIPQQPQQVATDAQIQKAVEQANSAAASNTNENVSFDYSPEINRMIVQVKDSTTGEVIREIPSKDFVKQQVAIREMIGLLLDKRA